MSLTSYRAAPPRVISVLRQQNRAGESPKGFCPDQRIRLCRMSLTQVAACGFHDWACDLCRSLAQEFFLSFSPDFSEAKRPLEGGLLFGWAGVRREDILFGFILAINRPGSDLLSRVLRRSTIGAGAFHGRVRNGNGCSHPAITTRSTKGKNVTGDGDKPNEKLARETLFVIF